MANRHRIKIIRSGQEEYCDDPYCYGHSTILYKCTSCDFVKKLGHGYGISDEKERRLLEIDHNIDLIFLNVFGRKR